MLFAALGHGPAFAGHMAAAALDGATAACLLCWSCAVTARRHGPVRSVLVACAVFLVCAGVQPGAAVGPLDATAPAVTVLLAVLRRWPAPRTASRGGEGAEANLAVRMGVVARYVFTATAVAGPGPARRRDVLALSGPRRHAGRAHAPPPGSGRSGGVPERGGPRRVRVPDLVRGAGRAAADGGRRRGLRRRRVLRGPGPVDAYAIRRNRSASLVRGQVRQASSGRIA
ncbi:hypothetical protein [Streptantibioticus ferralitis]|uniref:Uncharacterized protein n=1 Tax=Streptantibioticus ferralitis TaxID=236510 RepID=A0ABT5ZB97_9ACTN|nr:hypothetical protein [Streptantibioticus ferralitis]MDF2261054.1 hypothetical protein [Streptantibioticus ferralitis]